MTNEAIKFFSFKTSPFRDFSLRIIISETKFFSPLCSSPKEVPYYIYCGRIQSVSGPGLPVILSQQ